MKIQSFITGLLFLFIGSVQAQNVFQKTYGGVAADIGEGIKATPDAGFIVTGNTRTYGTGGAPETQDFLTIKANILGIPTWTRELGTSNRRQDAKSVTLTSDGGYVVGGRTHEVADINDSWLIKKYTGAGVPQIERVFGRNSGNPNGGFSWDDELWSIKETAVSNVVGMCGFSLNNRFANKKDLAFVVYNLNDSSMTFARHIGTDSTIIGNIEVGRDFITNLTATTSYTLLGGSNAMVPGNGQDFFIAHLGFPTFNLGSHKSFGGTGSDEPTSLIKTSDGGYMMVGFSNSPGTSGGNDILAIKIDASFNLTWAKFIGGAGTELAFQVKQTTDNGYVIIGQTDSYGFGSTDMLVVKLTSAGNLAWAKTYGGTGADDGRYMDVRSDGGFFFSGSCSEPVSPAGNGQDLYVVATNSTGYSGGCNEMAVTPNVNNPSVALTSAVTGLTNRSLVLPTLAQPMTRNTTPATVNCKCENYAPNEEITGAIQVCKNSSGQYYINPIPGHTNYLWTLTGASFASAPLATDTAVNINFTNTNAQLIVATNDGNCSDFVIDTINMTVDLLATAITTPDSLLCIGDGTTLTANTVNAQGGITGWVWTPAGPNNAVNNITPGATTVYSVTVTDGWGCTAGDVINVQVFNYPVVNIGPNDTVCNGGPVLLNATTAGGTYTWNTAANTPTINAATTGTYWVDVTTNGCTTRDSIILGISVGPTINIAGDDSICIGQNTILTANPSGGGGSYSYLWAGGLGTANNINVSPIINTTYTVTITEAFGCTNSATQLVNVFSYPVVNIGPNDTVCNGGPVLLNATTASSTYLWNTTATTATINAATSGIYWVDVDRFGCVTRDSVVLGISTNPVINIAGDDSICIGQNTILTANPSGGSGSYTYLWAGGLGTANNINVAPIVNATYTVTVTESFGCTNSATQLVNVFAYPVVNIGPNDTVCNGGPVLLNATTAGATYAWNTFASTATINAITSGIYWVDVTTNGCATRDSIVLGISTNPLISITGDDSICVGQSTTLTANPSGGSGSYTYLWSGGLGTASSISPSPITNTTYTVTVTEGFGCTNSETQLVYVFNYPIVPLGPDSGICNGAVPFVTLDAQNTGSTFNWSTSANTQTINVNTSGTYWVDVSLNGCSTRDSVVVTFSTTPTSGFLGNLTICEGSSTTIVGNGSGGTMPYTYTWSQGPTVADSITLSPIVPTNYNVITADLAGCSDTAFFTIVVNPNPIVNIGPDTTGCLNTPITLFAPVTTGTILWSTSASTSSITVPAPTTIWLDITENGCTTRDSAVINYYPIPNVNLGPDTVFCSIGSLLLDATNVYSTYLWSNAAVVPAINVAQTGLYWVQVNSCGITYSDSISVVMDTFSVYVVSLVPNDCGSSNGALTVTSNSIYPTTYNWTSGTSGTNPVLTNINDGTYIVDATDSVGCVRSITVPVVCNLPTIVITQLITPNGDGKNDTWIIQGLGNFPNLKVNVYNRWGNEVYNSAPYNNDWDGKSNSTISLGNDYLPAGTYFYVVDVYGDGSDVKSGYLEFQP